MSVENKINKKDKLEILERIIKSRPLGFTLQELYDNFQNDHKIGSRNTIKKYLDEMLEDGVINKRKIGHYVLYHSRSQVEIKKLFQEYPQIKALQLNLWRSLSIVFKDELNEKGKLIGKILFNSSDISKSPVLDVIKSIHDAEPKVRLKMISRKLKKGFLIGFEGQVETEINKNILYLTIKESELLNRGAWIFFYFQSGILESHLNAIHSQKFFVNIDYIDENKCIIKIEVIDTE